MPDQADNLRRLIPHGANSAPTSWSGLPMIAVTAARAGMGVTTLAVNLATVLADDDRRVVIIDANENGGNLLELCKMPKWRVKRTLADVLAGRCGLNEAMTPGPAGTHVVASGDSRLAFDSLRKTSHRVLGGIGDLRNEFDLVVVDLGSGLNAWTRRFWLQATLVLLAANTDSSALMDTYATIKRSIADGLGPDVGVVVNRCDDDRAAADVQNRLTNACEKFLNRTVPALPSLPPYETNADDCAMPRVWEDPHCAFSHAMQWLARAIADVLARASVSECVRMAA